jgi:hypothetical protein
MQLHKLALKAPLTPYYNVIGPCLIFGILLMMAIEGEQQDEAG